MRRLGLCLAVIAGLGWSSTAAAARTVPGAGPSATAKPSGCKNVAYTADGGYFSAAHFYWEPGYDVTLTTNWCYSDGLVTSYSESYTTTIPDNLDLRITTDDSLTKGGRVLDVRMYGDYNSNVINNTGDIGIAGYATGAGRHHFVNASGAGG